MSLLIIIHTTLLFDKRKGAQSSRVLGTSKRKHPRGACRVLYLQCISIPNLELHVHTESRRTTLYPFARGEKRHAEMTIQRQSFRSVYINAAKTVALRTVNSAVQLTGSCIAPDVSPVAVYTKFMPIGPPLPSAPLELKQLLLSTGVTSLGSANVISTH
jgi:hypothetical protein